MKDRIPLDVILEVLNDAYQRDPVSMWALMLTNRVPCNEQLSEHPTIPTESRHGGHTVSPLGVLNGIVFRLTGQMVAANWTEDEPGAPPRLLGFQRYSGTLPSKATGSGFQPAIQAGPNTEGRR